MFGLRAFPRFVATLAVVAVAACGGKDSTAPATPGTIVIKNASNIEIVVVNITSCSESTWGPDRLGATETIVPGAQRSFTVALGCQDVRARAGTGDQEWYDVNVTAGSSSVLEAGTFTSISNAPNRREGAALR
jgi:hypothetical protein